MNINEEIELLKQQKKEIEEKIKTLTAEDVYYGCAKFWRDHHPGIDNYNYIASVKIPEKRNIGKHRKDGFRYSIVCRAETKEETITELWNVIESLKGLYEKLTGDNK